MEKEKNNWVEIPYEFTELESEIFNKIAEPRGMDPRDVAGIVCAYHLMMAEKQVIPNGTEAT